MSNHSKKTLIYTVILSLFILSLIPLYLVGAHAHPSVDDYYYGVETARVWSETHSLWAVLRTSFQEMVNTYHNWQGNFSAVFLMRLQPAIFGEEFYVLTPILLISAYTVTSLLFYSTALTHLFHAEKYTANIISICLTFVSMQLTHEPSDSFFWYNGAIYYTLFHCFMLTLFSLMVIIRTGLRSGGSVLRLIPMVVLCLILAFLIGGGNFPTALLTAIILTLALAASVLNLFRMRNRGSSYTALFFGLITIFFFAAFIITLIAPGNTIRQESVGGSTGLMKTFLFTFAYGGYSIADILSAPCIVLFAALTPTFYSIARRSGYAFRFPLLVLLFTFGLYCSLGTPVFYAQGLRMPPRITNIIYFSGYIFLAFNLLYFLGWIGRKYGQTKLLSECAALLKTIKSNSRTLFISLCLVLAIFSVTCIGMIEVTENEQNIGSAEFTNLPMSASAVYSLVTGDAARYDRELNARAAYLSSSEERSVSVSPLSVYPELIFHAEITEDPAHWKNVHLALYYGKDAIHLTSVRSPSGSQE